MCVALIGGMDRLERDYETEAKKHGVELRVFTKTKTGLVTRLKSVDAIVLFTGKVSHQLRREATRAARSKNIPMIMLHSCGVCSLRECLHGLVVSGKESAGHVCCGLCGSGYCYQGGNGRAA